MPRYVIEEDRAIWVRDVYEVEADSADEAAEKHAGGDYGFLGFSLRDDVEHIDTAIASIEQTDATPFVRHPFAAPDHKPVVDAARELLDNLIDSGANQPELAPDDDEYPRDDDGNPWYSDCWKLYQALAAYDAG